ncbi:hypothetical protein RQP46_006991 [Phenoliferia psychrophenolica]
MASPSPRHHVRTSSAGSPKAVITRSPRGGPRTYARQEPAALDKFFKARLGEKDSDELDLPPLVPSGADSDSDEDSDEDDFADDPFLGGSPNRFKPLFYPALAPYESPTKKRVKQSITPLAFAPRTVKSEERYSLPSHLTSTAAAEDDNDESDDARFEGLPLTPLDHRPHITTVSLDPTACVNCGEAGPAAAATATIAFVQLDPCAHVLCTHCLAMLVNATSNEPPRKGDCFACQKEIASFQGIAFATGPRTAHKTPEKRSTRNGPFSTPQTIPGLSPFRNLNWSDDLLSSPGTSPQRSALLGVSSIWLVHGFYSSPATKAELAQTSTWPVVRVDNIPWDLKVSDVMDWIPTSVSLIPDSANALSIHILCNRADCRTLNMCFIELPNLAAAHALIRLKNAKLICGRPISVVLSSQTELLETVFPGWTPGFDGIDAANPEEEGVLLTPGDLEGLVDLCALELPHAIKAPERPFLQLVTIIVKLPWHQPEVYNLKLTARIIKAVHTAITMLASGIKHLNNDTTSKLLQIMLNAVTICPGFRESEKAKLLSAAENSFSSISTNPTTPTRRSSLVHDQLQSFPVPTTPSPLSTPPRAPRAPHTPSPLRHSFPAPPVRFAATPTPLPPSPVRQPFIVAAGAEATPTPPAQVDFGALAHSFGLDEDVVRSILLQGLQQMI